MSAVVTLDLAGWRPEVSAEAQRAAAHALEAGSVLVLPNVRFALRAEERGFLSTAVSDGRAKNISLDGTRLKGAAGSAPDRIYRRNVKDSIALRPNSPELYVLARIRDEAHRFANTFHRDRRSKATLRSELDAIPGIGATRRQRLLKHFGSVRAVRLASVEDLAKAPGMNKKAAEQVAKYFADVAVAESQATPDAEYEGDDSAGSAAPDDVTTDAIAATLDEPGVQSLIASAVARAPVAFDPTARRRLVIKSVSAKQRPRRPAKSGGAKSQAVARNS